MKLLQNRRRLTDSVNKLRVTKGDLWGGQTGDVQLAHAHYILSAWPVGTCCAAQGPRPYQ